MKLVLDAGAALEIVIGRKRAALFAEQVAQADLVIAPDLFVAEVVNTVWKYHQFEHLDLTACDRALETALALVDAFVPCKQICGEAFLLARSVRHPAYDMFYLALARREDTVLPTADNTLRKEAERQGVRVS